MPHTVTSSSSSSSSPPAPSVGLATKLGLGTAGAAIIPVVVDFLSNDAIDNATRRLLIVVAGGIVAVLILARSAQAIALVRSHPAGELITGELAYADAGGSPPSKLEQTVSRHDEELGHVLDRLSDLERGYGKTDAGDDGEAATDTPAPAPELEPIVDELVDLRRLVSGLVDERTKSLQKAYAEDLAREQAGAGAADTEELDVAEEDDDAVEDAAPPPAPESATMPDPVEADVEDSDALTEADLEARLKDGAA